MADSFQNIQNLNITIIETNCFLIIESCFKNFTLMDPKFTISKICSFLIHKVLKYDSQKYIFFF